MYQQITLIGRLGQDPELRYTPQGTPVCNFSVATDHTYTDQNGERQTRTTWFRVGVFGRQAEHCNNYLAKGRMVLVTGRVDASAWKDQEGNAHATLEVLAHTVRFLSPKDSGENSEEVREEPRPTLLEDDERPF